MGGSFALRFAAKYPNEVTGIICSAPGWHIRNCSGIIMKAAVGLLISTRHPVNLAVSNLVKQATCDPELRHRWQTNSQYRLKFSLSESLRGLVFFSRTGSYARKVKNLPVLMVHGLNDRLVKTQGTAALFSRIVSQDKELVLMGNAEHLVFEEVRLDNSVTRLVTDWIEARGKEQRQEAVRGVFLGTDVSIEAGKLFHDAGIENGEEDIVTSDVNDVVKTAMAVSGTEHEVRSAMLPKPIQSRSRLH